MNVSTISDDPFFSVIVPVYNKEKYLAKTIDSILKQSFRNFELLLILDPSTDKSDEIAYSFSDKRIRILKRNVPGPGGYAGRNLGISVARTNWIVFQDADDIWYEHHLMKVWEALLKPAREAAVVCTAYVTERNGALSDTRYSRTFRSRGDHFFDFSEFLLYKPICSINVAIYKPLLITVGAFPEEGFSRGGDHDTWLRVLNTARRGYWIADVTAIYNKNVPDGVIKSSPPYTIGHPVLIRVKELLISEKDEGVILALKRYANSFVITGIKHRLKAGVLTRKDVEALFKEVYSRKWMIYLFLVYTYLPFWIKRMCTTIYFGFKK